MITNSPAYVGLTECLKAMRGPCMTAVIKKGSDEGFNIIIATKERIMAIRDNYFDKEIKK